MTNTFKTSWTDEQLFKLSSSDNHKVVKLRSGDYMWKHNINEEWENHCISTFDDYSKPSHFLQYNLSKWMGELSSRRADKSRKNRAAARRLIQIKNSITRTTADKIKEIILLGLNLTQRELADELGVNIKTVNRAVAGDYTGVGDSFGIKKPRKVDSLLVYNINDTQGVRIKSKEYLDYVADFEEKVFDNRESKEG